MRVWELLKTLVCVILLPMYSIFVGYGHVLICVVAWHISVLECTFFICVTWCVVPILTYAVAASAAVPHRGPAVLHPAVIANLLCINCYFHHVYIFDTVCYAPREHGCRGSPIIFTKMWILACYANLRIQFSIHIFRGRLYPHGSKSLSIYFISFVSSNWVVINHQKGEIESAIKL